MPVEIKELIIRALVGDRQDEDEESEDSEEAEKETYAQNSQETISSVLKSLNQEKER